MIHELDTEIKKHNVELFEMPNQELFASFLKQCNKDKLKEVVLQKLNAKRFIVFGHKDKVRIVVDAMNAFLNEEKRRENDE